MQGKAFVKSSQLLYLLTELKAKRQMPSHCEVHWPIFLIEIDKKDYLQLSKRASFIKFSVKIALGKC